VSEIISLYIDADACPVKQEIYRVAERHAGKGVALKVFVVSNSPIAVPRDRRIEHGVVRSAADKSNNWIDRRYKKQLTPTAISADSCPVIIRAGG